MLQVRGSGHKSAVWRTVLHRASLGCRSSRCTVLSAALAARVASWNDDCTAVAVLVFVFVLVVSLIVGFRVFVCAMFAPDWALWHDDHGSVLAFAAWG